jgi:uncharacterized membrane protein YgaE (UPF0421/DUF939 family)
MARWQGIPHNNITSHLLRAAMAAAGCTLAIFLCNVLGLNNASSAGIITLLSLQNTKKETVFTALRRGWAFAMAVLIAFGCFSLLGYTLLAFGAYILIFVFVCRVFALENAIAICSVLVTHFWLSKNMAWVLIWNEALLLFLGAGIGILLNLFLPRQIGTIRKGQRQVEEQFRRILSQMAQNIVTGISGEEHYPANTTITEEIENRFAALEQTLLQVQKHAEAVAGNTLTMDARYYSQYSEMRNNQVNVLRRMQEDISRLRCIPEQAYPIAMLLEETAASFHEYNNSELLLDRVHALREDFRESDLPKERAEFEDRAMLFTLLADIEYFLILKNDFTKHLTVEQKKLFWSGEQ